jgi:hypothetical protein
MIAVPEAFPRRGAVAGDAVGVEIVAKAGVKSAAFAEERQLRAKADGEPFAEVEWFEQHRLHPFQRRADRLGDADFPV